MPHCRFDGHPLKHTFVDLGVSPLANAYLRKEQLAAPESFFPLHAYVCEKCLLVQLEQFATPQHLFEQYAYFSSYSDSWLESARRYADMILTRHPLGPGSRVVELASNDGYLLQFFRERGVHILGVEPARNVAAVAETRGIPTLCRFFGQETAAEMTANGQQADLLIANNVLAHVPDLNDFVAGMKLVLKQGGMITVEFPHLYQLITNNQFDTIYHEHFCYFSLHTVEKVFAAHGLTVFDVEEIPTHGGSLRVYVRHAREREPGALTQRGESVRSKERATGMDRLETYLTVSTRFEAVKRQLVRFCCEAKDSGKRVVAYGAPAKGNTLLNYCGIRTDLIEYAVDRSPHKQGLYLPGTHIPVKPVQTIFETKPDFVLILPWNLKEEVMEQMAGIREWGGRFVVPIPELAVYPPADVPQVAHAS